MCMQEEIDGGIMSKTDVSNRSVDHCRALTLWSTDNLISLICPLLTWQVALIAASHITRYLSLPLPTNLLLC